MTDESDHAGVTPTERVLFTLCRESFLRLWSYANVYRDQGKRNDGDGKELCDVVVVFGDDVILFSDKSCTFPKTGNIDVDWARWYRRSIDASQRQLAGAERWIRNFPSRVFIDRSCSKSLHIPLPPPHRMRVFKIIVATGAAERCRGYFEGGSGSFILKKNMGGDAGAANQARESPFTVPLQSQDGEVFHIVNEATLSVMLNELDTIADFVSYLTAKEQIVKSRTGITISGEENLVGLFLGAGAKLPEAVAIWADGFDSLYLEDGVYSNVLARPDYQNYVSANRISYFWDYLIDSHTRAVLEGTLVDGSVKTVSANEELLRVLAREPRVKRRLLAEAYLDWIAHAPSGEIGSRIADLGGDTLYVFQVHPESGSDYSDYRKDRQEYLVQYCFLAAWRRRDKKLVIGMVTRGVDPFSDGYDMVIWPIDAWTEEMVAMGDEVRRKMAKNVSRPLRAKKLASENLVPWDICGDRFPTTSSNTRKRFKKRKRRR